MLIIFEGRLSLMMNVLCGGTESHETCYDPHMNRLSCFIGLVYVIPPLCIHIAIESSPGDQSKLPNMDSRELPQLLALIATVVHDINLEIRNGSSRPLYVYNRGQLSAEKSMGARSTSLQSFSRIAWRNSADLELMSRVISGLVDAGQRVTLSAGQ